MRGRRPAVERAERPLPWSVVLVSGSASGVGKTAWIEALTRVLASQGHRVAVIKHHGHPVSCHAPGEHAGAPTGRTAGPAVGEKDTERARRAGATLRVLVGAGVLRWESDTPWDAAQALTAALGSLKLAAEPPDVVLAEGFRSVGGYPRLWVARPAGAVLSFAGGDFPPARDDSPTLVVEGGARPDEAHVREVLAWLSRYGFPHAAAPRRDGGDHPTSG